MQITPTAPEQWPALVAAAMAGQELTSEQAAAAMAAIMAGEVSPARIAALLVALRAKGETVAEMAGLAAAMRAVATPLPLEQGPTDPPFVDIVGTGGDRANTVNISTMAALVMAGAGARVVKHGNRAASSQCGSADLLEALGVDLEAPAERVAACARQVGITFCFAPRFHPAMRHVAPTRRELGVPTAFNFLGPLTNPAGVRHAALGVADTRMAALLAGVFAAQGGSALVFRGDDGLDELTTSTTSAVWVVAGGQVLPTRLDPLELGIDRSQPGQLAGGPPLHNAAVARAVLDGQPGPVREAVLLNAAAGLACLRLDSLTHAQDLACALVELLRECYAQACHALDSAAAAATLQRWVDFLR